MIVRRLKALPIEAVVRGYLIGSGWKDYQATGRICGIALPEGLRQAQRLPQPIFTPASKAAAGAHDENIPFEAVIALAGPAHRRPAARHRARALRASRPRTPPGAASSSPTPSSSSASTRAVA